jgi:3-methylcrotonyl-CoA carboxylase alpha subunit
MRIVSALVAAALALHTLLFHDGEAWAIARAGTDGAGGGSGAGDGALLAPMPGRIVAVDVAESEVVSNGRKLLVLEAMKREQALVAPFGGIVVMLGAKAGAQVSEGTLLARVERDV